MKYRNYLFFAFNLRLSASLLINPSFLLLGTLEIGRMQIIVKFFYFHKIFILFLTLISFNIITFSIWYIKKEEFLLFWKLLFGFIISIEVLVCGGSLISVFIGWEGVGIISFLLIRWFSRREEALFGGKKAVFYNRIGDFRVFLLILIERSQNFSFIGLSSLNLILRINFWILFLLLVRLAVLVKSAQFIFSPWLTSAIEGPTPVRSLLHRRTIVVAGVIFFYLCFPLISKVGLSKVFLILRIISVLAASLRAIFYKDIKKVVALSTGRQLGFIIIILSLGFPQLTLLHLMLHGFFKALLFLSRGRYIHNALSRQNRSYLVRFWGQNQKILIFRRLVGLIRLPFFGSFSRKHEFIRLCLFSPWQKPFLFFIIFLCLSLTISYRWSLTHKILFQKISYRGGNLKINFLIREKNYKSIFKNEIIPLRFIFLLILGSAWVISPIFLSAPSIRSPILNFLILVSFLWISVIGIVIYLIREVIKEIEYKISPLIFFFLSPFFHHLLLYRGKIICEFLDLTSEKVGLRWYWKKPTLQLYNLGHKKINSRESVSIILLNTIIIFSNFIIIIRL